MNIQIRNAYEKNLKNIEVEIPRNQLTVITGLSGSGKTTLLKDTLYMEAQRQYLEAMNYQGIQKPKVDEITNLSPAIIIDQEDRNDNPRSTLGTQTDIYTDLRMIFEKLHDRQCPNCRKEISASDSIEEIEKSNGKFTVYMICPKCNDRFEKLTRTHFSFNTKEGACPTCNGLGKSLAIQSNLYQKDRTIIDGGVRIWAKNYAEYQLKAFIALLNYLKIEMHENLHLRDFTDEQFEILKNGIHSEMISEGKRKNLPTKVSEGKYEGVEPKIWQKIADKKSIPSNLKEFVKEGICPDCHGEKLNELSRSATVFNQSLPVIETWELQHLLTWIEQIDNSMNHKKRALVKDYLLDVSTKIERISQVGLDYLSLNRPYLTLSGGEAQRLKLAAILDSRMTELIIILDEPTIGLHPSDTDGLLSMIQKIKARGNTVITIEHDGEFMKHADHIIEIGPQSGEYGGELVAAGTYDDLLNHPYSLLFRSHQNKYEQTSYQRQTSHKAVHLIDADSNNLKNISTTLPANCLSVITGVSGSGKSSLLFGEISSTGLKNSDKIQWLSKFEDLVIINQKRPNRNKRSVIATYMNVFDDIRSLFTKVAKRKNVDFSSSDFSFNTGNGRCSNCLGLGVVESNQLFFENIELPCPICHGNRYTDRLLEIRMDGHSIADVLNFSINEAIDFFERHSLDSTPLTLLGKTNLDYITLGQSTDTLSGGEMQRLSLASVISRKKGNNHLFIMDEPTTGMHKIDIYHFMELIQNLVDKGNTFFFIEHNLDVIRQADYVVELGPGGGDQGGNIVFSGNISDFIHADTKTSNYL
jgi:excinuclease ABC subunit A